MPRYIGESFGVFPAVPPGCSRPEILMHVPCRKPEVMSPAGYWPQLHAAIEAGADSVYFGLKHFTARAKVGFSLEELPDAIRTLHLRGVKGFITFNTLVFENELKEAAQAIAAIARAGADALIVQDVGIVKLAREIAPDLELHGSTQMSITSADGVKLAHELGVSRVTLARELSLKDIRSIREHTDCELEMFVHGALCVAYSGQCFSSEAWGGRSANRGQCAQACRLPYDLIVDGKNKPLGDARYLLSPGDLYTLEQIPEIVRLGISALKIEGRYKDSEYVALTTRAYRKAVDEAWAGVATTVAAAEKLQLEQVYSRGLGPYFVTGTNHQIVVNGRAPRHRGVQMGRVTRILPDAVELSPGDAHNLAPLKAGDGIVFDAADWRSPQEPEEGGRLYEISGRPGNKLELRFANGAVNFSRIRTGDLVWRSHDPELDRIAKPYLEAVSPIHKQPVRVTVTASEGARLEIEWKLSAGQIVVKQRSEEILSVAQKRHVSPGYIADQLGRLGNTPYELKGIELNITGTPFVPPSLLNQMRREAVETLQSKQGEFNTSSISDPLRVVNFAIPIAAPLASGNAELHLLVRTAEQLEAALELTPASITLDYLDFLGLKPSVKRVKSANIEVRVASPRVLKPGEERLIEFLLSLEAQILVRSTGLLHVLRAREHRELIGDFSLNSANSITADAFLHLGLQRLTPTHDLNGQQVAALARQMGGNSIEAIAYQHLPVFHTEHCVFCRFLSTGTTYEDCGRPCEKHVVSLRDLQGRSHPLMADVGCRNTVFGAEAQEASAHLASWRDAGIRHFRLEFAHESAKQVTEITHAFEALNGRRSYASLAQELKRITPQGTTQGSLTVIQ